MKRLLLTTLLMLATASSSLAIEEVSKVYLDEAIDVALKNNLDLKAAQINVGIAKHEIKSANRLQNPSIDTFYFMGGEANSEPRQIGISQNIEIAKRKARKKLAESKYSLVEKSVDYTAFDLKMDVREAYVELVAAKSVLDTLEQQKELQEELLSIAKSRTSKKEASSIDAIQVEIVLNQLNTQVNTARVNVKSALFNFNKIINTPDDIIYDSKDNIFLEENNYKEMDTPPPTHKFPEVSEIIKKGLKNRYDIKIAEQELDIAEKNLSVVTRQRVPDLALTGGYAYKTGHYSDSGHFNSGAYAGASLVNIPLFYNYLPEIQAAMMKVEQARLNVQSVKNKAIKDIRVAYEKFLTAAENLIQYENKIISDSERLIDLSMDSYEDGVSDITAIIVMKQSYKSIIVGYTYALAEYYNSWTDFLREVNDEDFDL